MTPRFLLPVLVVSLLTAVSACGDDAPAAQSPAAQGPAATVTIEQSRFSEREVVVPVGATVEFVNVDAFAHTVTSGEGAPVAFDSGTMDEGATFAVTFDEPGRYPYFCAVHPTMRATVVVE